jgi:hypothetical protein
MKLFKMGRIVARSKTPCAPLLRFSLPWWSFLVGRGAIFPGGFFHVENYRQYRENGEEIDNPQRKFPQDGYSKFIKGRIDGVYVCAVKNEGDEYYECDLIYVEGVEDKKWMVEKDGNYLTRIEREGRLKELEPLVYQLREVEHAAGDIREWWAEKVLLPELYCLFENRLSYNRFLIYDKFRRDTLHEIMEKAKDGEVNFREFDNKCIEHARGSFWYSNIGSWNASLMYDFDIHYISFNRMYHAICACPEIKVLDLSDINLSAGTPLVAICKLFRERNDFTKIILTNANLNDEALASLLSALIFNLEVRGIPLVESLILNTNKITDLYNIMYFLKKYITQYIKQQQGSSCVAIAPPPLRRIELCNNNLQSVEDREPINFSIFQSYEQELDALGCPLKLSIDLTGNPLAIYKSPCPDSPDVEPKVLPTDNEYACKFFVTSSLLKISSRIQKERFVTKESGFVYLMCRNYKFPEHVSIIIEMLSHTGLIALNKLELCVKEEDGVVKIKNTAFDALKLSDPWFFNHVYIRAFEVSTQLIKKLIDDVNADIANCTIKHSLFGRNGHNCATWAAEKLRNIGLDVEHSMFPVVVVTGKDFKAANAVRLGFDQ